MDNVKDKPPRPKRIRTLRNGRMELVKRPDSAGNAKVPAHRIIHGGTSKLLRTGRISANCTAGRLLDELFMWWGDHLRAVMGRDLTRLEQEDANDAARVELLKRLAWLEVGQATQRGDHEARAAAAGEYLKARRELAAIRTKYDAAGADALPVLDIAEQLAQMRPNDTTGDSPDAAE
jgi:hypothetical protein